MFKVAKPSFLRPVRSKAAIVSWTCVSLHEVAKKFHELHVSGGVCPRPLSRAATRVRWQETAAAAKRRANRILALPEGGLLFSKNQAVLHELRNSRKIGVKAVSVHL